MLCPMQLVYFLLRVCGSFEQTCWPVAWFKCLTATLGFDTWLSIDMILVLRHSISVSLSRLQLINGWLVQFLVIHQAHLPS